MLTNARFEDEIEVIYRDLEKVHKEDRTSFKVIIGEHNANIVVVVSETIMTTKIIHGFGENAVADNIKRSGQPTSLRWCKVKLSVTKPSKGCLTGLRVDTLA
ncbi:hypothetical protein ANCCAN_04029 [Ancylostoma caninum]|uniref:Uncharacterized protein n=1 Tax=Ancylostoma caninum TaxID=29170 RepID=A0A368H3F5_ANCCA|nr:hypothetical protein ANCCAN_04029 [Ancylostoma caninum]